VRLTLTDRSTLFSVLAEASRAPSAHNTQPARWRFEPDGTVHLFEDVTRRLPVADPTGHDGAIGLGAAFEGLHLALSSRGIRLLPLAASETSADAMAPDSIPPALRLVGCSSLVSTKAPDPLARFALERRTFRGRFLPTDPQALKGLDKLLRRSSRVVPLFARPDIEAIATLHDRCSAAFLRRPDYRGELCDWLRLTPRDPRWARDGLTADCLGLPRLAGPLAAALFRPPIFTVLQKLRLAPLLTTERAQTRSAAALLVVTAEKAEDPFETGRWFYRLWLDLCRTGLSACPMSALTDSALGNAYVRERCDLPLSQRIVNVLRVGKAPSRASVRSPRIPLAELLV